MLVLFRLVFHKLPRGALIGAGALNRANPVCVFTTLGQNPPSCSEDKVQGGKLHGCGKDMHHYQYVLHFVWVYIKSIGLIATKKKWRHLFFRSSRADNYKVIEI